MYLFRLSSVIFLFLFTCAFAAPYTQLRARETDSTPSTNTPPNIRILFDSLRDVFQLNPGLQETLLELVQESLIPGGLHSPLELSLSERVQLQQVRQKIAFSFPQEAQILKILDLAVKGDALPLIDFIRDGLSSRILSELLEDNQGNDSVTGAISSATDNVLASVFGDADS
ncbi:hypothetical protein BJ165DRAFT_1458269 [Panaeolus papilionaceus]|nr:hypothetical protein BJ165DRAFT_1458269 [Panaeolus papilionaceus]